MAQIELILPKMGESVAEATITSWLKKVGDSVEEDESILEIATDKVDSEVPSPETGVIAKLLFEEGETVQVGQAIALIDTEGGSAVAMTTESVAAPVAVAQAAPVQHATTAPQPSSNGGTIKITKKGSSLIYRTKVRRPLLHQLLVQPWPQVNQQKQQYMLRQLYL